MSSKQKAEIAAVLSLALMMSALGANRSLADSRKPSTGPDIGNETALDAGAQFSVNATYTTDYRFRGFTQTREKSALQGGAEVTWRHFYAGLWASNVDFGRRMDLAGRWHDTADVEVVSYAGVKQKMFGGEVDVRAIYSAFPGSSRVPNSFGQLGDLDYFEVVLGHKRELQASLTLDSSIYYSPDYQGGVGQNWVFESGLTQKLGTYGDVTPYISARLGSSYGEESKGGIDYYYWNAGGSIVFKDYFEFDLRYFDTFDVPNDVVGSCRNRCDGRVVARITFEN